MMYQSMLVVVLATLSLIGIAQAASPGWWDRPYDKNDLSKFFESLTELEAANREKREPKLDHFDLSHVANVIKGLDEAGEVKFIQENLPLINVLAESFRKHAKFAEKPEPWHSICDDQCAEQVVADYKANRPAELTGEVHDFSGSKCEELANILLEKDLSPLTDDHIHAAMTEYKAYIEGVTNLGGFTSPLSFELFNIERTVDYTNRFAGRLVSAMWPIYSFGPARGFASNFKHSVYEMLHANGYAIRDGQIISVPKTYPEFKP